MAGSSFDSYPSHPGSVTSPWKSSTCNRTYVVAAIRASAIAVVLLGLLVLLVLF
jgi:hypothetical protein